MVSPGTMIGVWIGGGLCSLLLAAAAVAAPPTARSGILTRSNETGPAHASAGVVSRLDLRAPDFRGAAAFSTASTLPGTVGPTVAERGGAASASSEFVPFPARGAATLAPQMTAESTAQQMARRFHREGLPLARLWQGHSAMVSLGLNQRGKPGLWLTQKIP